MQRQTSASILSEHTPNTETPLHSGGTMMSSNVTHDGFFGTINMERQNRLNSNNDNHLSTPIRSVTPVENTIDELERTLLCDLQKVRKARAILRTPDSNILITPPPPPPRNAGNTLASYNVWDPYRGIYENNNGNGNGNNNCNSPKKMSNLNAIDPSHLLHTEQINANELLDEDGIIDPFCHNPSLMGNESFNLKRNMLDTSEMTHPKNVYRVFPRFLLKSGMSQQMQAEYEMRERGLRNHNNDGSHNLNQIRQFGTLAQGYGLTDPGFKEPKLSD